MTPDSQSSDAQSIDTAAILMAPAGPVRDALQAAFAAKANDRYAEVRWIAPNVGELDGALQALFAADVKRVVCVPATLAQVDASGALSGCVAKHTSTQPAVQIALLDALQPGPHLLRAASMRVHAALVAAHATIHLVDCVLVVVAANTSVDGNGDVAKMTRLLWEGMGTGWAETAFVNHATAHLDAALDHAEKLGFKHTVVLPYSIGDDAVLAALQDAAAKRENLIVADALGAQPLVVDALIDAIDSAILGPPAMNCASCAYREQVIGG